MFVAALSGVRLASDGGGEHIDPRADDVLATTDTLREGRYLVRVTLTATVLDDSKALFVVRRRNAADDDTVESAVVAVPVDDCRQYDFAFGTDEGELISVTPYTDMIGIVMVAINYQRMT